MRSKCSCAYQVLLEVVVRERDTVWDSLVANKYMTIVPENTAICCQKRKVTSEILPGDIFFFTCRKPIWDCFLTEQVILQERKVSTETTIWKMSKVQKQIGFLK